MTSKVRVNMRMCPKCIEVTADLQDDGVTVKISVESDCTNVQQYAELLGDTVTMDDVMSFGTSRIFRPDVLLPLTMTCLVPSAVVTAASLELGMMTKSCAKVDGGNSIELVE